MIIVVCLSNYELCLNEECLLLLVSPLYELELMLPFSTVMSNVFMSNVFMRTVFMNSDVMSNPVAP